MKNFLFKSKVPFLSKTTRSRQFKSQNYKSLFSLLILFFVTTFLSPTIVLAQADQIGDLSVTPTSGIDYPLPYSGLLPDNSFYFLKVFRDKFLEFFISNPMKRAEYDLQLSDKRVAAAFRLVNENQEEVPLAISTFSKGENYFEIALEKLHEAKQQGMDNRNLFSTFRLSNAKHLEVLHNMERIAGRGNQKQFIVLEQRLHGFEKTLDKLKE